MIGGGVHFLGWPTVSGAKIGRALQEGHTVTTP